MVMLKMMIYIFYLIPQEYIDYQLYYNGNQKLSYSQSHKRFVLLKYYISGGLD